MGGFNRSFFTDCEEGRIHSALVVCWRRRNQKEGSSSSLFDLDQADAAAATFLGILMQRFSYCGRALCRCCLGLKLTGPAETRRPVSEARQLGRPADDEFAWLVDGEKREENEL
ncbi:UNVERIFIED_CONTAM: hypothetical protein Sindi_1443400 [Sesamum indicum]